jgi:hypothetical protein
MKKMISLHKHWITADAVKQVVFAEINPGKDIDLPEYLIELGKFHSSFARLSVLYGLIYVVIEGYKELKLADEEIDSLFEKEEYVDTLRLFRNSIFHYQKDPIPEKALKFLEAEGGEDWIRKIHKAFELFFLKQLPIKETLDKIKEGNAQQRH